jgi:hypothetical protein
MVRAVVGRALGLAAVLGLLLGVYFSGGWARALPGGETRVVAVDYVLAKGLPARVAEVKLDVAENAREVQIRLGKAGWIRCAVAARSARCRVPAGRGSVAALEQLSVFVRG